MQTASKSSYIFPLLIVKKKKRRDIKVDYLHTLQRVANSSELFFSKKKKCQRWCWWFRESLPLQKNTKLNIVLNLHSTLFSISNSNIFISIFLGASFVNLKPSTYY